MKFSAYVLIFFSCAALCLSAFNIFNSITHPIKFSNEIVETCYDLDLDPAIIASLINVESSYNQNAKSQKSAIGLMQIKLSTANYVAEIYNLKTLNENELFNPKINLEYGCRYLKYLIEKFENLETTLASYNAGETRVRSWLKNTDFSYDGKTLKYIPYKETKNYVKKIKKNLKFYKKIYKNT